MIKYLIFIFFPISVFTQALPSGFTTNKQQAKPIKIPVPFIPGYSVKLHNYYYVKKICEEQFRLTYKKSQNKKWEITSKGGFHPIYSKKKTENTAFNEVACYGNVVNIYVKKICEAYFKSAYRENQSENRKIANSKGKTKDITIYEVICYGNAVNISDPKIKQKIYLKEI